MMAPLTLGYWNVRGLAEPIRFLLHYKNVEFNDKRYIFDSGEWAKDKFNLGLDFPNLPYLFDGDVKLTQSNAILRYLGQKYQLDGQNQAEKVKVIMVEQQIAEFQWWYFMSMEFADDDKGLPSFREKAPLLLGELEKFLGDRKFLVGDDVTYVDFLFEETFDYYRYYVPDICKDFATLKAHQARIVGLPGVKEYISSSTYVRWPIWYPIAKWGGGGKEPERG